jgi:hypothetical protein
VERHAHDEQPAPAKYLCDTVRLSVDDPPQPAVDAKSRRKHHPGAGANPVGKRHQQLCPDERPVKTLDRPRRHRVSTLAYLRRRPPSSIRRSAATTSASALCTLCIRGPTSARGHCINSSRPECASGHAATITGHDSSTLQSSGLPSPSVTLSPSSRASATPAAR